MPDRWSERYTSPHLRRKCRLGDLVSACLLIQKLRCYLTPVGSTCPRNRTWAVYRSAASTCFSRSKTRGGRPRDQPTPVEFISTMEHLQPCRGLCTYRRTTELLGDMLRQVHIIHGVRHNATISKKNFFVCFRQLLPRWPTWIGWLASTYSPLSFFLSSWFTYTSSVSSNEDVNVCYFLGNATAPVLCYCKPRRVMTVCCI